MEEMNGGSARGGNRKGGMKEESGEGRKWGKGLEERESSKERKQKEEV